MMQWGNSGWGAAEWLAMSLIMLAFWGLLAALVVWLMRSSRAAPTPPSVGSADHAQSSDEVLAHRFARGEIGEEEFSRRRGLLRSGGEASTNGRD